MTWLYGATMFLSAVLLFAVQPLFAKLALPLLGGAPSVWNTCMVFYQGALLAGYLYAHVAVRRLGPLRNSVVHLVLLAVSLLALPLALPTGATPPGEGGMVVWLFWLLTVSVGVPFFMLAANAPMLQAWFAASGHPSGRDPYFLYAASNVGSMVALLGYPLFMEPLMTLTAQRLAWSACFVLLALGVATCALALRRARSRLDAPGLAATAAASAPGDTSARPDTPSGADEPAPSLSLKLRWLVLAFCPSSLLLAVTTYVTSDIAAVPLLWVVPLALYLLTYVLVFARRNPLPHWLMLKAQPLLVLPLLFTLLVPMGNLLLLLPLHLAGFFVTAMVCHGEMARTRPPASHLTGFYLIMSIGGVLGGIFNALIAPLIFTNLVEYPLVLVAAMFLRPNLPELGSGLRAGLRGILGGIRRADWLRPVVLTVLLLGVATLLEASGASAVWKYVLVGTGLFAAFSFSERPLRFGLGLSGVLLAALALQGLSTPELASERNFFGRLMVAEQVIPETGSFRRLVHGQTVHGIQNLAPGKRCEPLSYYSRGGPLGLFFAALREHRDAPLGHTAAVGLGVGSCGMYLRQDERLSYYEINPAVIRLARDPAYFTFLSECGQPPRMVLGDARLRLAEEPSANFDLLILDAFSSDAIPVHLLTREAVELYLDKLTPDGLLVVHISNLHLDLEKVLSAQARELGLAGRIAAETRTELPPGVTPSRWTVFSPDPHGLDFLDGPDSPWRELRPVPEMRSWTDDFSNIVSVFIW